MVKTKTFNSGNSQALRIPKDYRFDKENIIVNKIGKVLIAYEEDDRYSLLMESLHMFTDDYLSEGRPEQPKLDERIYFD